MARAWLHLTTADVPAYPENHDSLKDVRWWPATRTFNGRQYVLEFSGTHDDVGHSGLRSLAEIQPGWGYGAYYVSYSKSGKKSARCGPSYYWGSDGTPYERAYATLTGRRIWVHDRSGALVYYSYSEKASAWSLGVGTDEYYSSDGNLLGIRVGERRYWQGRKVEWAEFSRLMVAFIDSTYKEMKPDR